MPALLFRGAPGANKNSKTGARPSGSRRYSMPNMADAHVIIANPINNTDNSTQGTATRRPR